MYIYVCTFEKNFLVQKNLLTHIKTKLMKTIYKHDTVKDDVFFSHRRENEIA